MYGSNPNGSTAAAAALLLNALKHGCQITRIVSGTSQDLRSQNICFGFVLAAELQKVNTDTLAGNLSGCEPTETMYDRQHTLDAKAVK